jgi:hypothetical protein
VGCEGQPGSGCDRGVSEAEEVNGRNSMNTRLNSGERKGK